MGPGMTRLNYPVNGAGLTFEQRSDRKAGKVAAYPELHQVNSETLYGAPRAHSPHTTSGHKAEQG